MTTKSGHPNLDGKDYIVVQDICGDAFYKQVNDWCHKGFIPVGSMTILNVATVSVCMQTMHRKPKRASKQDDYGPAVW